MCSARGPNMSSGVGLELLFILLLCTFTASGIKIISREEWGARPSTNKRIIPWKLPYVIIHHSESPEACYTTDDCKAKMRTMQDYHQLVRKWDDIGYSFAIGGDGNIYEGRGFNIVGAHAPGYNDRSVGICFIGNWNDTVPPNNMIEKNWELLDYGVRVGRIEYDYTIYAHRQVRETDCPGDSFFDAIQKWPHFAYNVSESFKQLPLVIHKIV